MEEDVTPGSRCHHDFHALKISLGGEPFCSEPGENPSPAHVYGNQFRISFVMLNSPAMDPSLSLGWRLLEIPLGKGSPSAPRVAGVRDEAGGRWAGCREGSVESGL